MQKSLISNLLVFPVTLQRSLEHSRQPLVALLLRLQRLPALLFLDRLQLRRRVHLHPDLTHQLRPGCGRRLVPAPPGVFRRPPRGPRPVGAPCPSAVARFVSSPYPNQCRASPLPPSTSVSNALYVSIVP